MEDRRPVIVHLLEPITPTERTDYSRQLGRHIGDLRQVQNEKKRMAKHFLDQEKGLEREIEKLGGVLESGEELRPIHCCEKLFFSEGVARTYRVDNGDFVQQRPLTEEEMEGAIS